MALYYNQIHNFKLKTIINDEIIFSLATPFGQVPILEHNGKIVFQSQAICRYLGRELKLAGNNNWESMEVDMIVDTLTDLRMSKFVLFKRKIVLN